MKQKTVKYTPEFISALAPNQVFVFGSNLAGVHGAGAAETALRKFGAAWGEGIGHHGNSYAIPTKGQRIETLPRLVIAYFVDDFLDYAASRLDLEFLVTPVGCGLAGYTPEDIAPLFLKGPRIPTSNVIFPRNFYPQNQLTK